MTPTYGDRRFCPPKKQRLNIAPGKSSADIVLLGTTENPNYCGVRHFTLSSPLSSPQVAATIYQAESFQVADDHMNSFARPTCSPRTHHCVLAMAPFGGVENVKDFFSFLKGEDYLLLSGKKKKKNLYIW